MVQVRRPWLCVTAAGISVLTAALLPGRALSADRPEPARRLPVAVANIPSPATALPREIGQPGETVYPDTSDLGSASDAPGLERARADRHVDDSWREPETLLNALKGLAASGPAGKWAADVTREIQAFGPAIARGSLEATAVLKRLAELDRQGKALAEDASDKSLVRKLYQASYALGRRIDIWQEVVRLDNRKAIASVAPNVDPQKLSLCLAEIDSLTTASAEGRAWRNYLLVDALKESSGRQTLSDALATRQIAQTVLERLTETPLTPRQQKFVASGPVAALRVELRHWAAEPIGVAAVLRHIETYERTGLPSDARRLALDRQYLAASPVEERRRMAERLDMHWANANVRIAVTEELLNKLIPERNLEYAPVNDVVLGKPVHGNSLMASEAAIRMWPDPHRVRLAFEVTGEIAAETTADAGAVQVHNDSRTYYIARKPLEIDMEAIHLQWPAEVEVENETRLRGVTTPLDWIPLFGSMARGVARSQAEQSKSAVSREVKYKVAAQVQQAVDAEVRQRLAEAVDHMNQRVFDPLNSLSLNPHMIEAETTEKRFVMRLRVAGEDQLGSHTPRPRAPADSLASVQINESVLNNGIQRLQLNGRTFTLPELSEHVAARLNRPSPWEINPDCEDVKITFAETDAVIVRCQEGRVKLTLSVAQLSKGRQRWKNFQVRAFYKPAVDGRSAELARDGVIQIMPPGAHVLLRGIFVRALSKNNPWGLVPEQIVNAPKLSNAAITQFVIDDGWIGVALGPKRPVESTARRPHWALW